MFLQKHRFNARLVYLEEEVAKLQTIKANVANLEQQTASLRGSFNAKLGGMQEPKQKKQRQVNIMEDLTAEQREFVAGLPEWETERIKSLQDSE